MRRGKLAARKVAEIGHEPEPEQPDIDAALDDEPSKKAFWAAFRPVGAWWAELPPY